MYLLLHSIFNKMLENISLEILNVTESAAIASFKEFGLCNEQKADKEAVDAIRKSFKNIGICGTIVIGEGERDNAPMLYVGEKVGNQKGGKYDIALDPLEGTSLLANGKPNALSVLAISEKGGLLKAPDTYMQKIVIGLDNPRIVDLDESIVINLQNLAKAKKTSVKSLTVCILNRPRHYPIIESIKTLGSKISLIDEGDILGGISTSKYFNTGIDMYVGIGGAPEGVLTAAAIRCIGGFMQGRLLFQNSDEKNKAKKLNIQNLNRKYNLQEIVSKDLIFLATGVTDSFMLKGIKKNTQTSIIDSIIMYSKTKKIQKITTCISNK